MSGSAYTWSGADGGSWAASSNWTQGTTTAVQAPGSIDLAQFVSFSGTVTGAVGAQILDIGPGSSVTLGGSGFFSSVNIGQDLAFNTGDATLAIASGAVVSATLINVGSVGGGGGTLVANGTFSTTGGITLGSPGFAASIIVGGGGLVQDSASNLAMGNGGTIAVAPSGTMELGSGSGVAGAFSIESGHVFQGEGVINGNVVENGSLATANFGNSPTVLSITGNVTGTGSLSAVQELDVGGSIGAGVMVSLFGNGGTNAGLLRLAHPLADAGTLVTMSTNSTIALSGLTYDTAVWSPGSLTITGASGTLTLATSGDHSHQAFVARPDATSGTDIVVLACFAAGTRIATPDGPMPVEDLRPGDAVTTADGSPEKIVWIGSRTVRPARHPNPDALWPVRVRTGTFAPEVPARDLYLSPDHAVFVNGVLIPVRLLVDGDRIASVPRERVTYFHLELPAHSIILAEGLTVESYLDTGDRNDFDQGAVTSLHPGFGARPRPGAAMIWETRGAAPLVLSGPALSAARRLIADRGGIRRPGVRRGGPDGPRRR
jgi:collagen type I alpha